VPIQCDANLFAPHAETVCACKLFYHFRSFEKQMPQAATTAVLQASLLSREGKPREADAALAALAKADGSRTVDAQMLRAQLAAGSGDAEQALQHLSVRVGPACAAGCIAAVQAATLPYKLHPLLILDFLQ
jgi:hypothetical protein